MKTYEEFLNIFKKKEILNPKISLKEKIDKFLKTTDVEDIIYALHSVTDELGKPGGIEYWLHLDANRHGEYMLKLIDENNKFILNDYYNNVTSLNNIPDSMWNLEVCEATFEIEFLFYENQDYDITTNSEESEKNYELLKDFMIRILDEYKFEESDFQYENKGLRLIFKF